MPDYFRHFPQTVYNGIPVTDITRRVKIPEELTGSPYLFLPYTITEDDKPESVAYHYYGSVNFTWLVYYSNNIIDPYSDWIMSPENFERYVMKKYQELSNKSGYDIIAWTRDTTIDTNIKHYQKISDPSLKISRASYRLDPNIIHGEWRPVRLYEWEEERNENKRVIQLVNETYKERFKEELERVLNE